jgi:nicotinamidase-related amidase
MHDALVVVDMQVGMLEGPAKHDLAGVVGRINALAAAVRGRGGTVVWIRHCGKPGDGFAPHEPGWAFLPELDQRPEDAVVDKTLNDSFAGTSLQETLQAMAPDRVLVAGWATDFCVDATVRSAVSRDYHVVVVGDGHTLSDRPHLSALAVMQHHNWVWSGLITNRSIRIATAVELIGESARR